MKEHSPAANAGLRQGDTIIQYQGRAITDPRSLQGAVTRTPVGDHVTFTVLRDGSEVVLNTTKRVDCFHAEPCWDEEKDTYHQTSTSDAWGDSGSGPD